MRLLVTGGAGFLGRPLVRHLEAEGHEVTALSRATGLDVTDAAAVGAALDRVRPEVIYHLAGPAFVPDSKRDPLGFTRTHVEGTVHLLEAARRLPHPPRVLLTATADGYRPDPARLPFDEETPLEPENPYAAAKVAQEALGRAWWASWGLPVVRVRLFNLVGPGQDERFVASSFAKQAAEIALGRKPPRLEVGDLRVARDFLDWRDGIEALRIAAERGAPGQVYNICSGQPRPLRELLDFYLAEAGIAPEIVAPEHLARPGQAPVRYGDNRRLKGLGWTPRHAFPETLRAIYDGWRTALLSGAPA